MVTERDQDAFVLAVAEAGGDAGRALVHVKEAFADEGARPAVPAADLATLTRMEIDGELTATQAKQVLAEIVADGGGDARAIAAAKGFEAMDTRRVGGDGRRRDRCPARRLGEVLRRRGPERSARSSAR